MLTRLRSKFTYANLMATFAVFLMLTGIGYAVAALPKKSVGPRQLKNGAVRTKKIKKNAVNASKIKTGSVGRSEIASGAVNTGKISNQSVTRSKIADSAIPLLGTLRTGQTLRGSFNVGGDSTLGGAAAHDGYNFQFPLTNQPSAPSANVIDVAAGDPFTASCGGLSGGNNQTPIAAPGQLCVYVTGKTNLAAASPVAVENVNRLGFGLKATSLGVGDFVATGFWAVTAP